MNGSAPDAPARMRPNTERRRCVVRGAWCATADAEDERRMHRAVGGWNNPTGQGERPTLRDEREATARLEMSGLATLQHVATENPKCPSSSRRHHCPGVRNAQA
jgi:hypothetical protein